MLIGTVSAWLMRTYSYNDSDNLIGSVEMKLYADGQEVVGTTTEIEGGTKWTCNAPYIISGGNTTRLPKLTMRNMGTIDALVRVTMSLYYIDDYDNSAIDTDKRPALLTSETPTVKGTVKMTTRNWIYGFPSETVAMGYMYYTNKLAPYVKRTPNQNNTDIVETPVPANDIKLIDSIQVSSAQTNTIFYIDVTVDAVAYDGNIYKKIENGETSATDIPVYALPFGTKESLPDTWEAWK